MLPYSEGNRQGRRGPGIEEFWCLGRVAGETPYIELPNHHHYLAFFDILYLNGQSLLNETYETRWAALESVIQPVAGFSQLVERRPINVKAGRNEALLELAKISEEAKLKFHGQLVAVTKFPSTSCVQCADEVVVYYRRGCGAESCRVRI